MLHPATCPNVEKASGTSVWSFEGQAVSESLALERTNSLVEKIDNAASKAAQSILDGAGDGEKHTVGKPKLSRRPVFRRGVEGQNREQRQERRCSSARSLHRVPRRSALAES